MFPRLKNEHIMFFQKIKYLLKYRVLNPIDLSNCKEISLIGIVIILIVIDLLSSCTYNKKQPIIVSVNDGVDKLESVMLVEKLVKNIEKEKYCMNEVREPKEFRIFWIVPVYCVHVRAMQGAAVCGDEFDTGVPCASVYGSLKKLFSVDMANGEVAEMDINARLYLDGFPNFIINLY